MKITFILDFIGWTINQWRRGGNRENPEVARGGGVEPELQKMPHTKGQRFKPQARLELAQTQHRGGLGKQTWLHHAGLTDRLVGLVVRRPPRERKIPGVESRLRRDFFGVESVTQKLALQWLPCQTPGVIGSALGLVGPVSVDCDWVR